MHNDSLPFSLVPNSHCAGKKGERRGSCVTGVTDGEYAGRPRARAVPPSHLPNTWRALLPLAAPSIPLSDNKYIKLENEIPFLKLVKADCVQTMDSVSMSPKSPHRALHLTLKSSGPS